VSDGTVGSEREMGVGVVQTGGFTSKLGVRSNVEGWAGRLGLLKTTVVHGDMERNGSRLLEHSLLSKHLAQKCGFRPAASTECDRTLGWVKQREIGRWGGMMGRWRVWFRTWWF
jgi:hypothetical protein